MFSRSSCAWQLGRGVGAKYILLVQTSCCCEMCWDWLGCTAQSGVGLKGDSACAWKLFGTSDKPNPSIHFHPFLWHCTAFPSGYLYWIREMCKIKKGSSKLPSSRLAFVFAFTDFSQNNPVSPGDGPVSWSCNWAPLHSHPPRPWV